MNLQVSILTPEKPFWDGEAEEIILPAETGEMGILKNHAPIVCGLSVGAMLIRTKQEWQSVAIMGGFALVKQNQVTILANEAFAAESIDAEEARTTFEQIKLLRDGLVCTLTQFQIGTSKTKQQLGEKHVNYKIKIL